MLNWFQKALLNCVCVCACAQLVRKEGDFHAPRLLDEKEMRPNEDMQLKKKNRKSGTPCKVREQEGKGGKVSAGRLVCVEVGGVGGRGVVHSFHAFPTHTHTLP